MKIPRKKLFSVRKLTFAHSPPPSPSGAFLPAARCYSTILCTGGGGGADLRLNWKRSLSPPTRMDAVFRLPSLHPPSTSSLPLSLFPRPTTELPPLPMRYFKKVFPAAEEMGEQSEPCVFQKHRRNNSGLTLEAFPHSFDVFSLVKIWEEKQNKSAAICRIRLEINHDFGVLQRRAGGGKKSFLKFLARPPLRFPTLRARERKKGERKCSFAPPPPPIPPPPPAGAAFQFLSLRHPVCVCA